MFADLFGGRSRGGPFGGGGRGGGVRFGVGPTPGGGFGFFFRTPDGNFYMGDDSDDEDEWDRQWEGMHEEEELEKDQDAADLLGVALDADQDQIKVRLIIMFRLLCGFTAAPSFLLLTLHLPSHFRSTACVP